MTLLNYLWITILLIICAFGYGYLLGRTESDDADLKIVGSSAVVKKVIKGPPARVKNKLTNCMIQLDFYKSAYNAKPEYIHTTKADWIHVLRTDGYTEERHGIQVAQKGNWKLYVTIAGLSLLTGGIIVYKF